MLAKICSFLVDSTFATDWVSLKFEERSEDKANFPERSEDKANFPETLNNIFPSCARWYKISETKFQSQQTYLLSSFTSKFQLPWPAKPPSLTASDSFVTYMNRLQPLNRTLLIELPPLQVYQCPLSMCICRSELEESLNFHSSFIAGGAANPSYNDSICFQRHCH